MAKVIKSLMTERSWALVEAIRLRVANKHTPAIIEASLSHYLHGYLRQQAEYQVAEEDKPTAELKGD